MLAELFQGYVSITWYNFIRSINYATSYHIPEIPSTILFQVKMDENRKCSVLCEEKEKKHVLDAKASKLLAKRINQEYSVHL